MGNRDDGGDIPTSLILVHLVDLGILHIWFWLFRSILHIVHCSHVYHQYHPMYDGMRRRRDLLEHIAITPSYWPFHCSYRIISFRFKHLKSLDPGLSIFISFLRRRCYRGRRRGGVRRSVCIGRGWMPGGSMILFMWWTMGPGGYMIMTRGIFEFIQ
jgi:hypothetical protein